MPSNRGSVSLSSRDPSNKPIAVRLPADLVAAIDAACDEANITHSEFLRALVEQWAYGKSQLSGPDAGYAQARSIAAQLAHAAVRQALDNLPSTNEEARSMLEGYYNRPKKSR